jgi:hypothetical protein
MTDRVIGLDKMVWIEKAATRVQFWKSDLTEGRPVWA